MSSHTKPPKPKHQTRDSCEIPAGYLLLGYQDNCAEWRPGVLNPYWSPTNSRFLSGHVPAEIRAIPTLFRDLPYPSSSDSEGQARLHAFRPLIAHSRRRLTLETTWTCELGRRLSREDWVRLFFGDPNDPLARREANRVLHGMNEILALLEAR